MAGPIETTREVAVNERRAAEARLDVAGSPVVVGEKSRDEDRIARTREQIHALPFATKQPSLLSF